MTQSHNCCQKCKLPALPLPAALGAAGLPGTHGLWPAPPRTLPFACLDWPYGFDQPSLRYSCIWRGGKFENIGVAPAGGHGRVSTNPLRSMRY